MNNKECGRKAPFSLTIDRYSIFIQFKSDVVTGNRGFVAGFVAYSVGKYKHTSKVHKITPSDFLE